MNKIKVSKAVGKVLNGYTGCFDCTLIDLVKRQCNGTLRDDERALYDMNPIALSLAIVNGHEVELTTKEKWEERYRKAEYDSEYRKDIQMKSYAEATKYSIKFMNEEFDLGLNL